jgi:hypothetical protein
MLYNFSTFEKEMAMDKILLKHNADDVIETSVYVLSRSMTTQNVADFLDDYLNVGMKDYREGERVGALLQTSHRTIQASVIRFALGIIIGLSKQDYTDARNEMPIAMGKKITKMVETGELEMGWII